MAKRPLNRRVVIVLVVVFVTIVALGGIRYKSLDVQNDHDSCIYIDKYCIAIDALTRSTATPNFLSF